MKNLKKAEYAVVALTLICLIFTAGYFIGRGSAVQIVSFDKLAPVSVSPLDSNTPPEDKKVQNTPVSDTAVSNTPVSDTAVSDISPEPVSVPSASAVGVNPGTSEKIDVNTATQAKLEELPGIGPVLAQKIIDYRDKIGGFKRLEQIMDVDGIGEKKFDAMKNIIMIG